MIVFPTSYRRTYSRGVIAVYVINRRRVCFVLKTPAVGFVEVTGSGAESVLLAMKAYRDQGRIERGIATPNIVMCRHTQRGA